MKNKTMKRALIVTIISLALSILMLVPFFAIGFTYAWFTDIKQAGVNTIISGRLDMVLETTEDFVTWTPVDAGTHLFDENALFEPGYTQVAYVRVRNAGDLWFKYKFDAKVLSEETGINVASEEFRLSDYLKFGVLTDDVTAPFATRQEAIDAVKDDATGLVETAVAIDLPLGPGEVSDPIALVIYMPTEVGNEANYRAKQPSITLGLVAVATQYTQEEDSFDNQYDADAEYPDPALAALSNLPVDEVPTLTGYVSGDVVPADKALRFCSTQTLEDIAEKDYKNYDVDFVIVFNQDVDPADVYVFGQYDFFSPDWLGDKLSEAGITEVKKDIGVHLIKDWLCSVYSNVTVNYTDVVGNVKDFKCAIHVKNPMPGLEVTVKLVMTNPENGNEYVVSANSYAW